jgi:hypothetical protein
MLLCVLRPPCLTCSEIEDRRLKTPDTPTIPGGLTRYIVTTLVNIGNFCVFTRYKRRYTPSAETLQIGLGGVGYRGPQDPSHEQKQRPSYGWDIEMELYKFVEKHADDG